MIAKSRFSLFAICLSANSWCRWLLMHDIMTWSERNSLMYVPTVIEGERRLCKSLWNIDRMWRNKVSTRGGSNNGWYIPTVVWALAQKLDNQLSFRFISQLAWPEVWIHHIKMLPLIFREALLLLKHPHFALIFDYSTVTNSSIQVSVHKQVPVFPFLFSFERLWAIVAFRF